MFLSVMGLCNYKNGLFDNMAFPDDFTAEQKQTVIDTIQIETAELELIYPSWDVMKKAIEIWSKAYVPAWNRIYKASLLEYNPIENYNSIETETIDDTQNETLSGSDTNTSTNSNTTTTTDNTTTTGTDSTTNSVTAYESNTLATHDKSDLTRGTSVAESGSENAQGSGSTTYQYGKQTANIGTIERELTRKGNIGVTTSQQMLLQEIDIADKINIVPIIVNSFIKRFCIMVY